MRFCLLFLVAFSQMLWAQNTTDKQIPTTERGSYLGVNAGLGTVWMASQHNYGIEKFKGLPQLAYQFGVTGGITFKRGHGVHVEINYARQGHRYQEVRQIYESSNAPDLIGKNLNFTFYRLPLMYRRVVGINDGDLDIGESKLFWGIGVDVGILYDIDLEYTVNGEVDERYIFDSFFNERLEFPPASDFELFRPTDFMLTGSLGWERFLNEHAVFFAEVRAGVSILDTNHEDWRIANENTGYRASRNVGLYFKCGLQFYVNKVKRLEIY